MTPKEIKTRAEKLRGARQTTDAFWQEVADYMMPSREFTRSSAPGTRRGRRIMNDTPISAAEQLAGGLHGMLTSPALRWFKLRASKAPGIGHNGGPGYGEDDAAEAWFETVTEGMFAEFNSPKAGFDTAAHEVYLDITAFGNGCLFVGDGGRHGVQFVSVPLAECFITLNRIGKVNGLWRCFKATAEQILADWPDCSSKAVREAAAKAPDAKFDIVHAVYEKQKGEGGSWAYHSCYVLSGDDTELERGGFMEFPYVFARWSRRSGEDYGYGPGMQALPSIRQLNKIEEVNLRGSAKAMDPPMALPDDGFLGPVATQPGSLSYYRSGEPMKDRVFPLFAGVRPELGVEMIRLLEERIMRLFYVTWMNLPTQPNMTATEVLQRRDEQLRLLGPMVARLQQEFLGPLIERVFAVMARNGLVPPPPASLTEYEVDYQSPLALSQKASDADGVLRWLAAVAQMAQVDPRAADQVDVPRATRFLADRYGVPPSAVRDMAEAETMGDQRDQATQAAMQVEGLQGVAAAAKDGAGAVRDLATMQPQGAA